MGKWACCVGAIPTYLYAMTSLPWHSLESLLTFEPYIMGMSSVFRAEMLSLGGYPVSPLQFFIKKTVASATCALYTCQLLPKNIHSFSSDIHINV